jgi:hypothetical protein
MKGWLAQREMDTAFRLGSLLSEVSQIGSAGSQQPQ